MEKFKRFSFNEYLEIAHGGSDSANIRGRRSMFDEFLKIREVF